MVGSELRPLVEALDGDGSDDRGDDEDDAEREQVNAAKKHHREQPVVPEVELGPVPGQKIAYRVPQVRGEDEGDQHRGYPEKSADSALNDAQEEEGRESEQQAKVY